MVTNTFKSDSTAAAGLVSLQKVAPIHDILRPSLAAS